MVRPQSTSSQGENWQNAVTTSRSTPRWPHRDWDKQLYSPLKCYLPRRIAYSTTYLVLFFKLLLLQLCHLIKFNLHCLQKLEGCYLPLALPFFFCLEWALLDKFTSYIILWVCFIAKGFFPLCTDLHAFFYDILL